MDSFANIPLQNKLRQWSKFLSIAIILIAVLILSGRLLLNTDRTNYTKWLMPPLSAVFFLLISVCLLMSRYGALEKNRFLSFAISSIILLIGLAGLINIPATSTWLSGSMTYYSAFCFTITGLSLALLDIREALIQKFVQILTLFIAFTALLSIIGYLYRINKSQESLSYIHMPFLMAVCFIILSLAMLFYMADTGLMREFTNTLAGARLARSIFPLVIAIPILLGFFRLYGQWSEWYSMELGSALFVLATIIFFGAIIWYSAVLLNKRDRVKQETDKALKERELQFRNLLEAAPDAMVIVNEKGEIVLVNQQTETIFGYRREELFGRDVEMLMPVNFRNKHRNHRWGYFSNPKVRYMGSGLELFATRKDGNAFPVEISLSPLKTEEGILVLASIRDITEKKKVEEKFRSLLEAAPDAMVIVNEKGKIVLVNQQTEAIFGYQRDELFGKEVEMLMPASFRNKHPDHRSSFFSNPKIRSMGSGLELFATRKDGSEFPVEISLSPLETEEGMLVSASIRDITDRKKAQRQIAYMARLMEDVSDAIISADLNYVIRSWNRAAEKLYGYTASEAVGKPIVDLLRVQVSEKQRMETREELNTVGYWKGEAIHLNKNSNTIIVFVSVAVTRNEKAQADGYVLVCRDITANKKIEDQLKQFNEELAKQVRVKTNELTNIFERITDAFIALDDKFCYTYLNKKAGELIHHKPESLIGKYVWDVFPDAIDSSTYRAFARAMHEQVYVSNVDYYEPLNLWQENHIYPSSDGLSIFIRDISERMKSEQALKYSEETRRLIINSSLDAIVCIDDQGFITVWNPQAEKIFGWKEDEIKGMKLTDTIIPERYQKSHIAGLQYYKQTGKGPVLNRLMEISALNREGREFPIEMAIIPIRQTGEEIFCAFIRDITERKKAEESLKQSYEDIRQLASHLQVIREEERAGIAREIHDELGQQLTGLKMDMFWVTKKIGNYHDEQVEAKLNSTVSLLDKAVKTIRRISTNLHPSILDDLGLIPAIDWYCQEFTKRYGIPVAFQSNIQVNNFAHPVVIALFRITQESLTNIARHAEASSIHILFDQEEQIITLTIEDNGKGFEANKKTENRSLGLIGMRERTLMIGGEFDIESNPGKGTKLMIRVPVEQAFTK